MNSKISPQEIIEKYSREAPVNLAGIANELGVTLLEENLGTQVAGMIKKDPEKGGKSGFVIYVNSSDNPRRQRFTIAHELAHFMLHRELIGDGIQEDALYRGGFTDEIEKQANRLAASILMPFKLLQNIAPTAGNIGDLAKKLGVSEAALKIRLSK